jgi:hypothetical protein
MKLVNLVDGVVKEEERKSIPRISLEDTKENYYIAKGNNIPLHTGCITHFSHVGSLCVIDIPSVKLFI